LHVYASDYDNFSWPLKVSRNSTCAIFSPPAPNAVVPIFLKSVKSIFKMKRTKIRKVVAAAAAAGAVVAVVSVVSAVVQFCCSGWERVGREKSVMIVKTNVRTLIADHWLTQIILENPPLPLPCLWVFPDF